MTSRGPLPLPWPDDGDDEILLGEVTPRTPPTVGKPPATVTNADEEASEEEIDYTSLAPPQGLSVVQRRIICMDPIPLSEEEETGPPLTQFTLREVLVLMTFLSIGLAIMYYLPARQVAGVLGLLALIGQGLLMRYPPMHRHANLAAWTLLAMYVIAAATAFIQHIM